ncbi:MAG: hypothetical protein R3F20_18855 [Planctomycetota bacterium]
MFTRNSHRDRRSLRRPAPALTICALIAVFALSGPLAAQNGTKLTDPQKAKLTALVDVMKAALGTPIVDGKKGCLGATLKDLLAQGDPGGSVCYEKTKVTKDDGTTEEHETTLCEALDNLKKLIANDRVRLAALGGRTAGATRPKAGTDGDLILVNQLLWMGAYGNLGAAGGFNNAAWKMAMASMLINELTHVYQKFDATWGVQCDAERDSDVMSKKLECRLLDALQSPAPAIHTTIAAMNADAQAIPGFTKLLSDCWPAGAAEAGEIAKVFRMVKAMKAESSKRIADVFGVALQAGATPSATSWGEKYYGSRPARPIRYASDDALRSTTSLFDENDVDHTFAVPGGLITQSFVFLDDLDEVVLVSATHAPTGRMLHFRRDGDGDGLPEAAVVASIPFGAAGTLDPGLDGVSISEGLPAAFRPAGSPTGLMIHDHASGEVFGLALTATGLPAGPAIALLQDPLLAAGPNYLYLNEIFEIAPGQLRFVYSAATPAMQFGFAPGVALEGAGASPLGWAVAPAPGIAGATLAQLDPNADAAVARATDLCTGALLVHGRPGDLATVRLLDGPGTVLGSALIGPSGMAPVYVFPAPNCRNAAFRVEAGGEHTDHFVASAGRTVTGVAIPDENGDGLGDHLALSLDPPRLHLLLGLPSTNDARQHAVELVLEDADPGHIGTWNAGQRELESYRTEILEMTLLAGSNPPLYAQSLHDLDGDGTVAEGVVIARLSGQTQFQLQVLQNVPAAPTPIFMTGLPPAFVPDTYCINDLESDGDLDVCVRSLAGVDLSFVNDGSGNFTAVLGARFPGSGEDFRQVVSVNGDLGVCSGLVEPAGGDVVGVDLISPLGTFLYDPYLIVGQIYSPGFPPPGIPSLGLTINPGGVPAPFLIVDGTASNGLGGPQGIVLPGGNRFEFLIPPSASGVSLMMQALVIDPAAQNGFFAASDGTEVRFK